MDYAARAKNILNKPEINQKLTKKTLMKEYTAEIEKLKADLMSSRNKNGVFLTADRYKEMEKQIEELTSEVDCKMEQFNNVSTLFEKAQTELTEKTVALEATSLELDETSQTLVVTKTELVKTVQERDEQEYLVGQREVTEQNLLKEATEIVKVTDTTVNHIDALHNKIIRKAGVVQHNRSAATQLSDNLRKKFASLQKTHEDALDKRIENFESFNANVAKMIGEQKSVSQDLMAKSTNFLPAIEANQQGSIELTNSFSKSFAEQIEANFTETSDKKIELDSKTSQFVTSTIGGFVSSMQETISKQTELINSMQTLWQGFASSQKEMLGAFAHEHAQQIEVLQQHTEQHVTSLTENLTQQKAAVAKLSEERTQSAKAAMQDVQQQIGALLQGYVDTQASALESETSTLASQVSGTIERIPDFQSSMGQSVTAIGETISTMGSSSESSAQKHESQFNQLKTSVDECVGQNQEQLTQVTEEASKYETSMALQLKSLIDTTESNKSAQASELEGFKGSQTEFMADALKNNKSVLSAIEEAGALSNNISESKEQAFAGRTAVVSESVASHRYGGYCTSAFGFELLIWYCVRSIDLHTSLTTVLCNLQGNHGHVCDRSERCNRQIH